MLAGGCEKRALSAPDHSEIKDITVFVLFDFLYKPTTRVLSQQRRYV